MKNVQNRKRLTNQMHVPGQRKPLENEKLGGCVRKYRLSKDTISLESRTKSVLRVEQPEEEWIDQPATYKPLAPVTLRPAIRAIQFKLICDFAASSHKLPNRE